MLLPERKCDFCGSLFIPDRLRNIFCCRKCFRAHYRVTKKAMEITIILPVFACPFCHKKTQLEFDPRTTANYERWAHFKCPSCHHERITIEDGRVFQN